MRGHVGDHERRSSYEVLFRSHYRAVENFVRARFSSADTDSIMSATFEVAWRRFEAIPADGARGWLIGVARNCGLNELRRSRRAAVYLDALRRASHPAEMDVAVAATDRDALVAAFAELSPSDQEVLLLAEWDGLVGADLAAALGVTTSAAGVRLHRARTRLRAHLAEEGGDS